jgi:hypothetical protein
MIEATEFYKKWIRYLKENKLYGRYLLDIQSANKLAYERKKQRNKHGDAWWVDFTLCYCSKIDIFLTKADIFKDRFYINDFRTLKEHIWSLCYYFGPKESIFLSDTYKKYCSFVEKNRLPIPRGFRKKKGRVRLKGSSEENSPWYNSYYQDKKVLWRR